MKKYIYKLVLRLIRYILVNKSTPLSAETLKSWGWELTHIQRYGKDCWKEPDIKERDQVLIEIEDHYYRVWHGPNGTFIALESSVEWLQTYLLLMDKHNVKL